MKRVTLLIAIVLFAISSLFAVADTSGYIEIPERHKYKEINLSVFVADMVNDSVGDTLNIIMYGRNAAAKTTGGITANGYTEWQRAYFNCIASPDFASPANYPQVDSIIQIELVDSQWIYIPAISTPMFTDIKFVIYIQQSAARTISVKNAKMYVQVDCRAETPAPSKKSFYLIKRITSQ